MTPTPEDIGVNQHYERNAEIAREGRTRADTLATQLAECAGYIASVRTDRQITRDGDVYALQTLEWAEGALEIAEKANAVLEAWDARDDKEDARTLVELAEIGRLAVEEEKLRRALKAKYLASGGKTDDCMGLYDTFFKAAVAHREAVCAYLAKHPTEKP